MTPKKIIKTAVKELGYTDDFFKFDGSESIETKVRNGFSLENATIQELRLLKKNNKRLSKLKRVIHRLLTENNTFFLRTGKRYWGAAYITFCNNSDRNTYILMFNNID